MRRITLALTAALALIAGLFVAAPASNAADVSFVQGLVKGRFGSYQAFDVSRVPPLPTCTDKVPDRFQVTVTSNGGNPDGSPYSGAAHAVVNIGNGYLMVFRTGDADYPWGIRYYNRNGLELRWNGTSWVLPANPDWATAKPFSEGGVIVGVNESSFLHISKETGPGWDGGFGTFFSITEPRIPGELIRYTPDRDMNTCRSYTTPNDNGTSTTQVGPVLNAETSKTMYVPDHPLGPPTGVATLKWISPNAGEIEGLVKKNVFTYNWGVATAGTSALSLRLYPTNPAATMRVAGELYRSGQPIRNIAVSPGSPKTIEIEVTSVDGENTQNYTINLTAYPTNVAPQVRKLSTKFTSNRGGQKLTITGVGFTYAKGVVFSPNSNVYDDRAVEVKKTKENIAKGIFKIVNDREIEVVVPAVPKDLPVAPKSASNDKFWTGEYNVLIDTPFGNSGYDSRGVITYQNPQKPVTPLEWAKSLVVPGLTKLLGLPIKMNSLQIPKITISVKWRGFRAKPAGDMPSYEIMQKADGWYISLPDQAPVTVTAVITAQHTAEYAPYYKEKSWNS